MPLWAKWVLGVCSGLIVLSFGTVVGTGFSLVGRMSSLETAQRLSREHTKEEFREVDKRLDRIEAKLDRLIESQNGKGRK